MRTLEFRAYPTQAQAQQLDAWLLLHRRLWNYGLALLQELDDHSAYDKASKTRYACCPVPWSYRWKKADDDSWQPIPYSEVRRHRKAGLSCPIPQDHRQPRLTGSSYQSLTAFFAKRNHPNWPELQGCPNTMIRGTLKALATAWAESKKTKLDSLGRRRKPPRFKSERFPITTLSDNDCKSTATVDGDLVKLPLLGSLRIRGNKHGNRWPADLQACTYRLMREPSGWYLLLVGDIPAPTFRDTALAVGLDAGVAHTLTTSAGRHIDGPRALACNLRRLKRLQQQQARQTKGGANWCKTQEKIAALHEKIRRTRKAFAHQQTTFLLRTYDTIAIEDLNHDGMARRAKPKPKEDGTGYEHNGAAAKTGLNRSLRDAGIGTLYTMLETKARQFTEEVRQQAVAPLRQQLQSRIAATADPDQRKEVAAAALSQLKAAMEAIPAPRTVKRVNPAHTSQACSHCGAIDKASRRSQSLYSCTSCGHTMNADHNAALNILARAT